MCKFLFFFITFFIFVSIQAQVHKKALENRLKSITVSKQDFEAGGKSMMESMTFYDTRGNIVEEFEYDNLGKETKHIAYQFDENNNRIKETEYKSGEKFPK